MTGGATDLDGFHRENRERLLRFIRSRVEDDALAEDVLQECLIRAMNSDTTFEDQDRFTTWFYRVVRNAITDVYRRRGARDRRLEALAAASPEIDPPPEVERAICECFRPLLPTMKTEYAELIEAMELGDVTTEEMTARLGISSNNLKVRRHRARRQLRDRLERTCRSCAQHGCLDCSCEARGATDG